MLALTFALSSRGGVRMYVRAHHLGGGDLVHCGGVCRRSPAGIANAFLTHCLCSCRCYSCPSSVYQRTFRLDLPVCVFARSFLATVREISRRNRSNVLKTRFTSKVFIRETFTRYRIRDFILIF